jgi:hypothetical protein
MKLRIKKISAATSEQKECGRITKSARGNPRALSEDKDEAEDYFFLV